jgi:hypothetical protein
MVMAKYFVEDNGGFSNLIKELISYKKTFEIEKM